MHQSQNQNRVSIGQKEKTELTAQDFKKLLKTRITQTKEEIEKLEAKLDVFKPENAKSQNQKQYFHDRRKFIFTNIRLLQAHLGKLIQNQAILEDENIEEAKLENMLGSIQDLSHQNLEIMKNFQTLNQTPDDQPLPPDFIMMSERVARNYKVIQTQEEVDDKFDKLNNYFQNEIQKYYKNPISAPYLKYVPKIV
ncbi:unnamed protein product (macronuclear) [Paramecium tetraurelia]|uniref:Uncharacterized protein n=1 Tax=Paramecium tetraurelia TaxID=5888 RepID=A0EFA8_PARTE|nr:uncharacterized protein GSPATT00026322001 [Paramecium tetraurelia]CAK93999.1 unnamed protein product [Paramecium tetraurelia]|eukprot:XP_001461372.1 hypothetical protein (macronuclear) [Paramecium tetraurelia strain d4-2]